MSQKQVHRPNGGEDPSDTAGQTHVHNEETDTAAILDEIDLVLEENASEFVSSFVQKGGQ